MTEILKEKVIEMFKKASSNVTVVLNENQDSDSITIIAGRSAYRELTGSDVVMYLHKKEGEK